MNDIRFSVDDREVKKLLASFPKEAGRAAEIALDKTAYEIRDAVKDKMRNVFHAPVTYTLNSLQVTKTQNHNMIASVWFKDPVRMRQHYLVPQVEGGQRKLKGFERALGGIKFVPGEGATMTKNGNVSVGQIRQVLSVLGRAEMSAGYMANITALSKKTNKKTRDYVVLPRGSGRMPPGIYQRVTASGSRGVSSKRKTSLGLGFGEYQSGKKKSSVIKARGLKPILVLGWQNARVKPLLPFYETAEKAYNKNFLRLFYVQFDKLIGS